MIEFREQTMICKNEQNHLRFLRNPRNSTQLLTNSDLPHANNVHLQLREADNGPSFYTMRDPEKNDGIAIFGKIIDEFGNKTTKLPSERSPPPFPPAPPFEWNKTNLCDSLAQRKKENEPIKFGPWSHMITYDLEKWKKGDASNVRYPYQLRMSACTSASFVRRKKPASD